MSCRLLPKASSGISPIIKPILALFPDANLQPGNKFTFPFSQPATEDYVQMRVDQNFSAKATMFVRYTIDSTTQSQTQSYPQFHSTRGSRNQYSTLSENHVFSASLLNTARFSYSRTAISDLAAPGPTGPEFSLVPGQIIGTISIGGITALGPDTSAPTDFRQNIFTWSDDLFYTRGRHSLKFGALINRYQLYMKAVGTNFRGTVNFANPANFLQGLASSYVAATPGSVLDRSYAFSTVGQYVQDEFHFNSRLPLNVGLRYEFLTQPNEVRGHGAALRDVQHDSATTLGIPFKNPSLKDFSPRFGFAWDVNGDGKTAVRGGLACSMTSAM